VGLDGQADFLATPHLASGPDLSSNDV
jgi:hypothetical protein